MSKALLKAAALGQNTKLETLLNEGVDVDFSDKMPGRTALIEAAIEGHLETVRFLIARGAGLDLTDRTLGYTALGWASYNGNCQIIRILLEAGANINLTSNDFEHSPLMVAARAGHTDAVFALLTAGADVHQQTKAGCNALSMSESNHHHEITTLLKQHGAQLPQLLPEIYLPWPLLAEDLSNVDDADPVSVLRGFILAMNHWEMDCGQHFQLVGFENLDWTFINQGQEAVFLRFCTLKPRPYGRHGSFSALQPDYTPEESLLEMNIDGSRAQLMTRQAPDKSVRCENIYVLVRKNKQWRVDSKKYRVFGAVKWDQGIL